MRLEVSDGQRGGSGREEGGVRVVLVLVLVLVIVIVSSTCTSTSTSRSRSRSPDAIGEGTKLVTKNHEY
jgi:hypothetical protein